MKFQYRNINGHEEENGVAGCEGTLRQGAEVVEGVSDMIVCRREKDGPEPWS